MNFGPGPMVYTLKATLLRPRYWPLLLIVVIGAIVRRRQ